MQAANCGLTVSYPSAGNEANVPALATKCSHFQKRTIRFWSSLHSVSRDHNKRSEWTSKFSIPDPCEATLHNCNPFGKKESEKKKINHFAPCVCSLLRKLITQVVVIVKHWQNLAINLMQQKRKYVLYICHSLCVSFTHTLTHTQSRCWTVDIMRWRVNNSFSSPSLRSRTAPISCPRALAAHASLSYTCTHSHTHTHAQCFPLLLFHPPAST